MKIKLLALFLLHTYSFFSFLGDSKKDLEAKYVKEGSNKFENIFKEYKELTVNNFKKTSNSKTDTNNENQAKGNTEINNKSDNSKRLLEELKKTDEKKNEKIPEKNAPKNNENEKSEKTPHDKLIPDIVDKEGNKTFLIFDTKKHPKNFRNATEQLMGCKLKYKINF